MLTQSDSARRYKWDDHTQTGYQLRHDAEAEAKGSHFCWHVEDWTYHTVTNEWQCRSLDEALEVLGRLFDLDTAEERRRVLGMDHGELAAAA
jgi:hypothetical protein